MGYGQIGFSQPGNVAVPSPAVWADCGSTLLKDKALGVFLNQDFNGDYATPAATTTAPGIETITGAGTAVFGNAASATYGPNVLSMATGGSDNNNTGIFGEELGQIILNSGRKLWFEARVALAALGDAAFFVGLSTRAGANTATTGIIAADPSNSAAAALVAVSNVGFRSVQLGSAIATVNTCYANAAATIITSASTLPNGTVADVTSSTAFQASQANLPTGTVITQAAAVTAQASYPIGEGLVVAYGNLTANCFRKFGMRFDGYKYLHWYIDGVEFSKTTIDSTFDQTSYWSPCIVLKNGASTALTLAVDWIRAAYQSRF